MKTFLQIFQMLPMLFQAVEAAEAFIPLPGKGQAKLDFILKTVQDTYGDVSGLIPTITKIIGNIVALGNSSGKFTKAA